MEQNNFKQNLQPALKFAGVLGTVGGFIGDVLSPLGPVLNYLLYLSIIVLIISLVLLVLLPKSKKQVFKMASLSSLFFSIIFGVFVNLNKDSENGFLGDNVEFVSEFQASLNIIEVKLDEISDQIEVVDEKLDKVDNKIEEGFANLSEEIKNSNPIKNPKTPKDHIINAYLFMDGGDLQKAEESFISFFNLSNKYYLDAMNDFVNVMLNNKGYNYVKTYFETNKIDDQVFELYKLIYSQKTKDLELIEKIKTSNLDQNLIDFAFVMLTNDSDFYMRIISEDRSLNYSFPINNIDHVIRFKEKGLIELDYLILSKSKIKDLLTSGGNANLNGGKSLLEFYFTTFEIPLKTLETSGVRTIDESKNKARASFLYLISSNNKRVELPKDWDFNSGKDVMEYFIEKQGDRYYLGTPIPTDEDIVLYNKWIEAKKRLEQL